MGSSPPLHGAAKRSDTCLKSGGELRLSPFTRPRQSQAADQQQQPEQPRKHRQYADAAHHARVAHLHAHPVVALEAIAGAHRDDARQVDVRAFAFGEPP